MRYLDPKANITFRKVFYENPSLLISFLNAMLPLDNEQEVVEIDYLAAEFAPNLPIAKYSIIDVRCTDNRGKQFIVKIQMEWTDCFLECVFFNYLHADIKHLGLNNKQPVYCLLFIDANIEKESTEFYSHYNIVYNKDSKKVIDNAHLIFIELPKFNANSLNNNKIQSLWLRFLTEINEYQVDELPEWLLENSIIKKATDILLEHTYTSAELMVYERFWDSVSTERTLIRGKYEEGKDEGKARAGWR